MATRMSMLEEPEVYYPESDRKPMAETDLHGKQMLDAIAALTHFFRNQPDVYVSGNLCLYYEKGVKGSYVAPDVLVTKGIGKEERRTYKVWEEGKPPDVIIEMTSRETRDEDVFFKRNLYEQVLKTTEYFTFDPTGDYLDPPLQGYRLVKGKYARIKETRGRLPSNELGLALAVENGWLRFYDLLTGEKLLTPQEAYAAQEQAEAALEQTEARLEQAEAELARLRAELTALRGKGKQGTKT